MNFVYPKSINIGRNELCHCGSGKKYKKCCLDKDEEARRELIKKQNKELMDMIEVKKREILLKLQGDSVNIDSKEKE